MYFRNLFAKANTRKTSRVHKTKKGAKATATGVKDGAKWTGKKVKKGAKWTGKQAEKGADAVSDTYKDVKADLKKKN